MEKYGQGGNPQFERTFADLAYSHLREQAPKLLDYMVGFQVIDKNEDETQAAGVFGFQLGQQWFYAPVFFLNGELKGHELLYIKSQDSFVPLQENWVNYLLNRKPVQLGESSAYTESDLAFNRPDFQVYSRSPLRGSFSKLAAAEYDEKRADERYGYWHDGHRFDITPVLRCFMINPMTGPTFKAAAARMDLEVVLKDIGKQAAAVILQNVKNNPLFGSAISTFYSPSKLFPEHAKRAQAAREQQQDTLDALLHPEKKAEEQKDADTVVYTKVRIVRRGHPDEPAMENMTDNERSELLRDGYTVMDQRDPESRSRVYDNTAIQCLTNPDGTGLYDVLVKPADLERFFISYNPKTIGRGTAHCATVVRLSNKKFQNVGAKDIFVAPPALGEWDEFWHGLPSVESMAVGTGYIIVGPMGETSLPFTLVEKSDEDEYKVHVHDMISRSVNGIHDDYTRRDPIGHRSSTYPSIEHEEPTASLPQDPKPETDFDYGDDLEYMKHSVRTVVIVDRMDHLHPMGNSLLVPRMFKVLEVDANRYNRGELGVQLGNINDAEMAIRKQAGLVDIVVSHNSPYYSIKVGDANISHLTKIDAIEQLVCSFNTSVTDARLMIKGAQEKGKELYLLKAAEPLIPGPGGVSPALVDASSSYDSVLGVPVEISEPITESLNLPMGPEELYDPMQIEPNVMSAAQRAADSGQKDVLDVSVLSGLVKAMDVDSYTDKYLTDIVVGLDRIGRILFMFYWHNEKFEDRYGDDELRELEDALKNTFKSVGDLVLFLKKKTIDPEVAMAGSDVDLDDVS